MNVPVRCTFKRGSAAATKISGALHLQARGAAAAKISVRCTLTHRGHFTAA